MEPRATHLVAGVVYHREEEIIEEQRQEHLRHKAGEGWREDWEISAGVHDVI